MIYLYVEPRQVRLESLMRISDITDMTNFSLQEVQASGKDKYPLLVDHIQNYYADNDVLKIDGNSFRPDSIRVELLNVTLSGLKVIDIATVKDESSLLVGVSQQYLIDALPQKIDTDWQYFNQHIDRIPVIVTDPVGPLQNFIQKDDPGLGWQNFLKKYQEPVIRPVNVETGWSVTIPYIGKTQLFSQMPDQQQVLTIVSELLENVRIAFVEKAPDSFSRELGKVISSNQAETPQKELAKLFSPKVTGGGIGSVKSFDNLQVIGLQELDAPDGFSATISGSATISAQHWGHIDQRQLKFQLLLDSIQVDQQWRLADLTLIDIKDAG